MKTELPHGYWNPKIELMPKGQLKRLQLRRLEAALRYAWESSPYYRSLMKKHGVALETITTLEDFFRSFPVTRREDLNRDQLENPPFGTRLAVPLENPLRYHATSGTTGQPAVRAFDTERDWIWGADAWATSLYNFGVRPNDVVMIAFGYGSFIGFWGAHYAFEKIGCRVHPTGSMDTKTRIQMILDLGITVLCCTPSYAIRILHVAGEEGIDLAARSRLNMIVVAGEPGASIKSTKDIIEKGFNAHLGDFMGTTETAGMIASTCSRLCGGLHINEDRYLTEVVDPDNLKPVGYGKRGMMVVTPLIKEAMPLFRYATNDIVILERSNVCRCGRTLDLFMGGILGRYDDMVKVRGVQLTPQMIEEIVRSFPEVEEFFTTAEIRDGLDILLIRFEVKKDVNSQLAEHICRQIKASTKQNLGLSPEVAVEPYNSLPRFELKARRFKDLRNKSN
ncbi:MAG: AMP-binding protein [Deltaproteobacteria bacterium]|nr:AMP-binding protein [Deltaproteobacteria bacterium]